MLLIYVRHGDPIYTPDQLTPLGERQAESVAHRLALFGVDEIYASTSNRAMQTAMPSCELLGKKLNTLDFLNENYLNGLKIPNEEKENKLSWVWSHPIYSQIITSRDVREMGDKWYDHPALERFHFENTILPINEQMDKLIASYGYEHDLEKGLYNITESHTEKRIAIFAHECMAKIVMSHLLDIPFPSYAAHFEMHTSAFSVICFDSGSPIGKEESRSQYARARVLSMSNDSHLYRDGLPLMHRFNGLRKQY